MHLEQCRKLLGPALRSKLPGQHDERYLPCGGKLLVVQRAVVQGNALQLRQQQFLRHVHGERLFVAQWRPVLQRNADGL